MVKEILRFSHICLLLHICLPPLPEPLMPPLPYAENICNAKHGWRLAAYHALCHGHAFQCLEEWRNLGPWGISWGHVKISYCIKQKINTSVPWGQDYTWVENYRCHIAHLNRAVKNLNTSITKRKDNIACLLAFDLFGTVRLHMLLALKQDKEVLVTY